jgi:acyl carrier protein
MSELHSDLQEVFRRIFDDDGLEIAESTSAANVDGWDSMGHINLIIAVEKRFGVKFAAGEIATLGRPGQTVAAMIQLLAAKTGRQAK